jgi:hypothetical protein
MANEFDLNGIGGYIGTAVGALIASIIGTGAYFNKKKIDDAASDSTVKGYKGNDGLLDRLEKEQIKQGARITELETKIEQLTDKLANVRLIALECFQLANDCECIGEGKDMLREHLKSIIRDA